METPPDLKPKVSIILPALLGYETVAAALDAWDAQTCRDQLELIVVCPSKPAGEVPSGHIILETGDNLLNEARAKGAHAAAADYIMFAEDHCIPDPDCMEWIIRRLDEGWDAVGPALRPGDPGVISHGAFLISYAQWMQTKSGPVAHLPGHNAVVRKKLVLERGEELVDLLIASMFLMAKLHSLGCRFYLESQARMRHFDSIDWAQTRQIFLAVGQACGAVRQRKASMLGRIAYGILTPVTAARHFSRGLVHQARLGFRDGFTPASVVVSAYFASVWAIGETIGAFRGLDQVKPMLWISEIKPVTRDRVALAEVSTV